MVKLKIHGEVEIDLHGYHPHDICGEPLTTMVRQAACRGWVAIWTSKPKHISPAGSSDSTAPGARTPASARRLPPLSCRRAGAVASFTRCHIAIRPLHRTI